MYGNISVVYVPGSQTAGSQGMPHSSLVHTAGDQFSKVMKSIYTATGISIGIPVALPPRPNSALLGFLTIVTLMGIHW